MMTGLRVGFLGLGLMGRPMASRLLDAGHTLSFVVNRDRTAVAELIEKGAREFASPGELAALSDVVVLCLPGGGAIERVLFGPGGVIEAGRQLLVVDCSTSQPDVTLDIAARLTATGIRFVDAPVVRGPREAQSGRLVALAGGADDDVAQARPVLAAFCENIVHVGAVGAGQQVKLINNFLALGGLALLGEAYALATRLGVDLPRMCEAVSLGGGNSRVFQAMVPWITERDERRAQASLANAFKDVSYYAQMAADAGGPHALATGVREAFAGALDAGYGERLLPNLLEYFAQTAPALPPAAPR